MSEERDDEGMGGWGEYRKLILAELRRLSASISRLDEKLETKLNAHAEMRARLTAIEVSIEAKKSDLKWLIGTIIAMAAILIAIFKQH